MARRLAAALTAAALALSADAAALKIQISDADLGEPLEGVRLSVDGKEAGRSGADGAAVLTVPDGAVSVRVLAQLPGYQPAKAVVRADSGKLELKLSLGEALEGQGLVVERPAPAKDDSQAGIAKVASKEAIHDTAEIGIVEDAMASVKLLPGVGYAGGWNAQPSIRGGDPNETTAVLDGAYVLSPYHWGGAFSIFNPNMVESAKLSNGLISARYGQVMSGLLEVETRLPAAAAPQFNFDLSTTGLDAFVLAPLGADAGFMLGGKVTWMEASFAMAGVADQFETVPYIRDGIARFYWKPADKLRLDGNLFLGSDGIAISVDQDTGGLKENQHFSWENRSLLASGSAKWLVSDSVLVEALGAYNRTAASIDFESATNGSRSYDTAFQTANQALIDSVSYGATGFSLNGLASSFAQTMTYQSWQGRVNADWTLAPGKTLSFGSEEFLKTLSTDGDVSIWSDVTDPADPNSKIFALVSPSVKVAGNNVLTSSAYSLYRFETKSGLWSGEAGVRVDHAYLYNSDMALNTPPSVNPRIRFELTPWRDKGWIESLGFVAGSGLYAQVPIETAMFDKSYGLKDGDVKAEKALFNLIGIDLKGQDGWSFSLEGYYKQYFDRLFITYDTAAAAGSNGDVYSVHENGTGYAYGFDFMLMKKTSRRWDGWLSYSYVEARYRNPVSGAAATTEETNADPINEWYYPAYHRFHTLNLVLNWKPADGFQATVIASLASGAPKKAVGDVYSYASVYTDPATGTQQVIERYTQSSKYSDTLRTDLSCPVDVKFSWFGYYKGTKVRWEYYFAVQNLFGSLYKPQSNKSFDPWTGEVSAAGESADYNIPAPVPSFGFKLSY